MTFAVQPKTDCPHVIQAPIRDEVDLTTPCKTCGDTTENWLCVFCGHSFCSRYVKGHMTAHWQQSRPTASSFSSASSSPPCRANRWSRKAGSGRLGVAKLGVLRKKASPSKHSQLPAAEPTCTQEDDEKTSDDAPQRPNHCIAVSYSDLSAWCFECDSYITSPRLDPLTNALHMAKFGEPDPELEAKAQKQTEAGPEPIIGQALSASLNQSSEPTPSAASESDALETIISPAVLADALREQIALAETYLAELTPKPKDPVLASFDLAGVVELVKSGQAKNIIVMSGAGISTSCGIPDFRTPGTGLYSNLEQYNLPTPESIFEIGYFKQNPKPFFTLAKELFPGNFDPAPAHRFIKLLADKGLLLRHFTQNIDGLDSIAGIPSELTVEAHGSFLSAACVDCGECYSQNFVKEAVFRDEIPECKECESGIVKPDITFFGEGLPERFKELSFDDFPQADLLIIMGTSLNVQPFAGLIKRVGKNVPRLLINRDPVGQSSFTGDFESDSDPNSDTDDELGITSALLSDGDRQIQALEARLKSLKRRCMVVRLESMYGGGLKYGQAGNHRDVFHQGTCDDGARSFVEMMGWSESI